ncbi:alpha/beta-hydrolase [Thozetella sp. PMI_491]|nr:alpha/beta-hydrolase [Thozetella sp. PMI_491]
MPFTEANGKRLFYYKAEPVKAVQPQNLSVLAIHGLGSSHAFYLSVFPDLAAAGLTCFSYDTYGSGLSVLSGDPEQSVESMAQDTLSLMENLGLTAERTFIIGHSMGGMVACQLASKHRFAGVVLLGPVHPNPAAAGIFAKRIDVVNQSGMEAMADVIPIAATGSKSTPMQHAWIRSLILSQQPTGYISLCRVIASATAPVYRDIVSPLLIIAGSEDKSAPMDGCLSIFERQNLAVLEGVGHWHCVEAPQEVGRLFLQHMAKS